MPPKARNTPKIDKTEDGRLHHRFRQSTVSTLETCLEKGRMQLTGQLDRWESDAASLGTAVHEAIEAALQELRDDNSRMTIDTMHQIACDAFSDLSEVEGFRWTQLAGIDHANDVIRRCLEGWYHDFFPHLEPAAMEIPFEGVKVYEDDKRIITVEGTIDLRDSRIGLGDWKTANQKYRAWEKERWNIQATIYTFAGHQLEWDGCTDDDVPFTFFVMLKQGKDLTQQVTVTRNAADWRWLEMKLRSFALLAESKLPEWPRMDSHALCSPKWCENWFDCKGKSLHDPANWPDVRVPAADAHYDPF